MALDRKEKKKLAFDTGNEFLDYLRLHQIPHDAGMGALALALTKIAIHVGIPHETFVDRMSKTYKNMVNSEKEDQSWH